MMHPLEQFTYSQSPLTQQDLDGFKRAGVGLRALAFPDMVFKARVLFDGRFFDIAHPDEAGVSAFILPVRNQFEDMIDVLAWRGGKICTLLGRAWILGEENLYAPRIIHGGALPVWRSPLPWLMAERTGVVILDYQKAALNALDFGPLLAEDAAHRAFLRQRLTIPLPRILLPSSAEVAA
jgi:hypothetical protein